MLPFFRFNRALFVFVKDRQSEGIMIKYNPIIVFIGRSLHSRYIILLGQMFSYLIMKAGCDYHGAFLSHVSVLEPLYSILPIQS